MSAAWYRTKAVFFMLTWPLIVVVVNLYVFFAAQPKALREWWYLSNPGHGFRKEYRYMWERFKAGGPA